MRTPELTFDGFGINGSDEYRTRLATFTRAALADGRAKEYGELFANAPATLAALRVACSERDAADPLTVAYIALGAKGVLADCDDLPGGYGELEFIGECVAHASMLDALFTELNKEHDFSGVFAYNVAEPFGEACAYALIAGTAFDARDVATRMINAERT